MASRKDASGKWGIVAMAGSILNRLIKRTTASGLDLISRFALILLLLQLVLIHDAKATNILANGALDGMVFAGKIGGNENPSIDDKLHFKDGTFWSTFCVKFGLAPGKYWARSVGDQIEFRGVLKGEPGSFAYMGSVHEGIATVSMQWTKRRWYWTIEKELNFVGKLVPRTEEPSMNPTAKTALETLNGSL